MTGPQVRVNCRLQRPESADRMWLVLSDQVHSINNRFLFWDPMPKTGDWHRQVVPRKLFAKQDLGDIASTLAAQQGNRSKTPAAAVRKHLTPTGPAVRLGPFHQPT